jgi:hypothetical protein
MNKEFSSGPSGLAILPPPDPPTLGGEAPSAFSQLIDANSTNGLRPTKSPKVGGLGGLP